MGLYHTKEVDFQHEDMRGRLVQLVHGGFRQVNVLESKAGAERGAHFHKRAMEAFYVVCGSVEVAFWDKGATERAGFKRGDFFEIPPYVIHHMHFPEDCLMVQMYDIPVEREDGTKDIFMEGEFNA